MHLRVVIFWVLTLCLLFPQNASLSRRPDTINIGALLAYNTTMGKVAKKAIELAVEDVNGNSSVLNGTRLVLTMVDSNCSAFIGTAAALELMKKDMVAIVGPQSSVLAHVVSQLASELQVPLVSFAATDPTLSSSQYPYFLRIAHSDFSQMEAIAAVVAYYQWRKVVAVYVDDDYGRNGISVLDGALRNVRAKITYRAVLPPGASRSHIGSILVQLALMESRVLVLHVNPSMGLNIFAEASFHGMMNSGYVWMATDWLSSTSDSTVLDSATMNSLQGVIGLRKHIRISDQQHVFTLRWNNLRKARTVDTHLNVFGLYAYDTVWAIAQAISTFFSEGGNTSFVSYSQLSPENGNKSEMSQLKFFKGGSQLLKLLLKTNFTGLIGPVQLDKHGDLLGSTFELINIAGTGFKSVGYWSSQFGLSVNPLEANQSSLKQQLYDVVWPGQSKLVPRGWVFPNNGKHLLIGVPKKADFQEFVTTVEGTNMMTGFCIDVFVAAVNLLPYAFPYRFVSFVQKNSSPSYNDLVEQVFLKKFEAAVGDISIVANRSKIVDFTQPYIYSGLVMVTRVTDSNNAWAFLQPFKLGMWCTISAFFLIVGAVIWIVEHKTNPQFRGQPKQQFATILWFGFSTMFFSHSALFAYNSALGRVAKKVMELAVEDVNGNSSVLNGTRLVMTTMDSNCSTFTGTFAALELMKKDMMAIVGPQTSVLAHVVSQLASELQVPLVSFAATDPTLSSYQYPYFLRITHSDFSQMEAIAAVVDHYGWRKVVAVYVDDDYGRNGISVLDDALRNVRAKITYRAALPPGASRSRIASVLVQLALMESRILVLHANPNMGLNIFAEASFHGMLNNGYVWIVTDWLSSTLDSKLLDSDTMNSLQGVIGLRKHTPISDQQRAFTIRWNNLIKARTVDTHLNVFGLYAYDTVWAIARAISTFFSEGGNTSFVSYPQLSTVNGNKSEMAQLKIFKGGSQLLKLLLKTNFTGLIGPVQLDKHGDLLGSTFELINIVGTGFRSVGYWSSQFGLSVNPLEANQSSSKQQLYDIVWPGESKLVPRGWVFPNNEKHLLIGVPKKAGFHEFVTTVEGTNMMTGFCIDVFLAAVNLLPYAFPYTFVSFVQNNSTPSYNDLVEQVVLKKFEAAVGDISIVAKRLKTVDFTQPYIDSGLVVVIPTRVTNSNNAWAFLQPFTPGMWCTIGASFLVIGAVIWILEHKTNPEFRGQPKQQFATIIWFSFSTMFFSHRENTMSALGRAVLIIWLFVVLIINSSFTASMTSILTARQLTPSVDGIDSLITSQSPIGYQRGSFARNYLIQELGVDPLRLIPLESTENYAKALSIGPNKGGVAAIVDELPYAQVFLSTQCGYTIVGQQFTRSGWGFAFQKDSELAIDISAAILTLSDSGELQRIHDKWLNQTGCSSEQNQVKSDQLSLKSFWGLFLISGLVCFVSLFVFFCRIIFQFIHHSRNYNSQDCSASGSGSLTSRSTKALRSFVSFVDMKETEKTESSKRKMSDRQANRGPELSPGHNSTHLSSLNQAFNGDPQSSSAQTAV